MATNRLPASLGLCPAIRLHTHRVIPAQEYGAVAILKSLAITRGRDGMLAVERKHRPLEIPIFGTDQVTDVTGAGDR
jgi:sugar/nucleoside kinase (ribokinase family)